MAAASELLFTFATWAVALAFAAHVGHAVLLANGRRTFPALAANRQPAFAGVVTGSFVSSTATERPDSAAASPLGRAAIITSLVAFGLLGASLVLRGVVVGRGPWGNLFEFSEAFATSILGGYLFLQRRYAIRSIGFIP